MDSTSFSEGEVVSFLFLIIFHAIKVMIPTPKRIDKAITGIMILGFNPDYSVSIDLPYSANWKNE